MKTGRVLALIGLPLILTFLAAGCATRRPLVETWHDPQFSPTPADKIALTGRDSPSQMDEALSRLLVTELQREGFALASPDQADYLINCVFDESTERQRVLVHANYDPMMNHGPPTPQTSAQTMTMTYQPLPPPPDRTVTYSFTRQSILLYLYSNPKTHAGKFQLVWQGSINVNQSVPAGGEEILLKTLLGYFGKNQNGQVDMTP